MEEEDNNKIVICDCIGGDNQFEKHYQFDHDRFRIVLTKDPLNILDGINFVKSQRCGAINTFLGTVRDTDLKKSDCLISTPARYSPIVALEYEAYCPLAFKQLISIVKMQIIEEEKADCLRKETIPVMLDTYEMRGKIQKNGLLDSGLHSLNDSTDKNAKIYLGARVGRVHVGQEAIIICVSSTSRHFSHSVTMKILEKVKAHVAIWKKILFSDGTYEWASGCKC